LISEDFSKISKQSDKDNGYFMYGDLCTSIAHFMFNNFVSKIVPFMR